VWSGNRYTNRHPWFIQGPVFRAQPLQPHRTRKAFAFSSARCQSEDVTLSGGSNLSYNVYDSAQRSSAPPCEIVKNFHFPATNSVQKGEVSDPCAGYQRSYVPPRPRSSAGDRGGYNNNKFTTLLKRVTPLYVRCVQAVCDLCTGV
jgi:hypothetical protein